VRSGDVLATAEVAATGRSRRKGLLGRQRLDGAFVLRPCRHVHTIGMRFAIDVAYCDRDGVVLRTGCLRPWRLAPIVPRTRMVVEAAAGAFERWALAPGDVIEIKE
jgi:hypothetical protein